MSLLLYSIKLNLALCILLWFLFKIGTSNVFLKNDNFVLKITFYCFNSHVLLNISILYCSNMIFLISLWENLFSSFNLNYHNIHLLGLLAMVTHYTYHTSIKILTDVYKLLIKKKTIKLVFSISLVFLLLIIFIK